MNRWARSVLPRNALPSAISGSFQEGHRQPSSPGSRSLTTVPVVGIARIVITVIIVVMTIIVIIAITVIISIFVIIVMIAIIVIIVIIASLTAMGVAVVGPRTFILALTFLDSGQQLTFRPWQDFACRLWRQSVFMHVCTSSGTDVHEGKTTYTYICTYVSCASVWFTEASTRIYGERFSSPSL